MTGFMVCDLVGECYIFVANVTFSVGNVIFSVENGTFLTPGQFLITGSGSQKPFHFKNVIFAIRNIAKNIHTQTWVTDFLIFSYAT